MLLTKQPDIYIGLINKPETIITLMTFDMMILIRNTLLLLLLFPAVALAVGSPDFLPDGPHPRIWLTSTELSALVGLRDANDSKWAALESWCDSHINDSGYNVDPANQSTQDLTNWDGDSSYNGYRMSGWARHLMNYALGYQVLKQPGSSQDTGKAANYAARAKTLVIDGIATALRAGEESNGLKALRVGSLHDTTLNSSEATALGIGARSYKGGYSARFTAAVPVVYDWIYDTLSEGEKTTIRNMLLRWFDWTFGVRSTYNNGVLISGTRYHEDTNGDCTGSNNCTGVPSGEAQKGYAYKDTGNNFAGGFSSMLAYIAVSTYGDYAEDDTYLSTLKTYLNTYFVGPLDNDLLHSGGDSPEGWNYGGGFIYTLPGLYGYYTATGDTAVTSMEWPKKLVKAALHRAGGDFKTVPFWGYWTGTPYKENRITHVGPFVGIESKLRPSGDEAKLGKWLLENSTFTTTLEEWQNVFYNSTPVSAASPASVSEPLGYLAKGNGLFISRSSWDKSNDVVHVTARLEGKITTAHEGYDEGHFTVTRGADVLLGHDNTGSGDAPPAVSFNTIVFNNANHRANTTVLQPPVDRYSVTSNYSYISGDITSAWDYKYGDNYAELFRRSVLHIRPGFVIIYDVTKSTASRGNLKDWYTQYEADPSQDGNTITVTNRASRGFVTSLYPAGSFTETNPSAGYYRVNFVPTVTQEYDQFLHVIEATDSARSQTTASLVTGTGGRGAKVGNTVAMFTDSQSGANISSLSYTADATTHYVADLPVNSQVSVTKDSVAVSGSPFSSGTAGIISFSAASGSGNYQVSVAGTSPTGRRYPFRSISGGD